MSDIQLKAAIEASRGQGAVEEDDDEEEQQELAICRKGREWAAAAAAAVAGLVGLLTKSQPHIWKTATTTATTTIWLIKQKQRNALAALFKTRCGIIHRSQFLICAANKRGAHNCIIAGECNAIYVVELLDSTNAKGIEVKNSSR